MSGSVGVIADATARYTQFSECLVGLTTKMPVNTVVQFRIGPDRGRCRDWLVEQSLQRGSEWILFLDDDHSFPPTLLLQLLAHEQPIVSSLYLRRTNPFLPIAYESKDDAGLYMPIDLTDAPSEGLRKIVAAGSGGMLIRSEVFHAIEPPWFLHTDEQSEDLFFCDRAREAGFPLYVDLSARLGHIAPLNFVPVHVEDEGWKASIVVSPTLSIVLDIDYGRDE